MAKDAVIPARTPTSPIPRPRLDVIERSQQHPFGIPSSPVELAEAGLICRWVNTELKGGAQLHYFTDHGYLKCRPEYLKYPDRVQHKVSVDGYVVRGMREEEILMYTTRDHYLELRRRKDEANRRSLLPQVARAETVESASRTLGDEAASYLHERTGPVGTIDTSYERIQRTGDE